jgi:hypothetical protein
MNNGSVDIQIVYTNLQNVKHKKSTIVYYLLLNTRKVYFIQFVHYTQRMNDTFCIINGMHKVFISQIMY